MALFKTTVDVKETIWHRCSAEIEANSLEEAQDELIRRRDDDDYENMDSEYLIETGCPLTKSELFLLNNQDLCLPDADDYADEIDSISLYEFPSDINYQLNDEDELKDNQEIK